MFINMWISTRQKMRVNKLKVIRSYTHSYPHVFIITFLIRFLGVVSELSGNKRNVSHNKFRDDSCYEIHE